MSKKSLAAIAVMTFAGCATPAPKEALMDWSSFIASVPGNSIIDADYKTPTLKRSAHRANTLGLEQTKASFGLWCKAHGGQLSNLPPLQNTGAARIFYGAATAWSNQELVLNGQRYSNTPLFCINGQEQLTAAILIRAYGGYRNTPYQPPDKQPAPVLAFYTPEQATQFADFYNAREKARAETSRKEVLARMDQEAEDTRRLRTDPKIGDRTSQGIIIELRPPLALIQYSETQRQIFGKPQSEWVQISSLTAPQ